ncbi:hypothetical protein ACH432_26125, partial [Streptomyces jumonjinensis]
MDQSRREDGTGERRGPVGGRGRPFTGRLRSQGWTRLSGVDWRAQAPADWPAGIAAGIALALPLLVGTA